jgi:hypothetical protein
MDPTSLVKTELAGFLGVGKRKMTAATQRADEQGFFRRIPMG